jgi:hypothetical protein
MCIEVFHADFYSKLPKDISLQLIPDVLLTGRNIHIVTYTGYVWAVVCD